MREPLPSPASNSLPVAVLEWLWERETVKRGGALLLLGALLIRYVLTGRRTY
jgi:hypothetical protein